MLFDISDSYLTFHARPGTTFTLVRLHLHDNVRVYRVCWLPWDSVFISVTVTWSFWKIWCIFKKVNKYNPEREGENKKF